MTLSLPFRVRGAHFDRFIQAKAPGNDGAKTTISVLSTSGRTFSLLQAIVVRFGGGVHRFSRASALGRRFKPFWPTLSRGDPSLSSVSKPVAKAEAATG
jgi:hypothetical protein